MSNIIHSIGYQDNNSSPFDAIRGYRADGTEYWTARELMRFLGYVSWQKFKPTVDQAIENLELAGNDVTQHLILKDGLGTYATLDNPKNTEDYELSRLACYHVALACNGKGKPMVAMAKQYFAVQTYKQELASEPKIPAILPEVRAVQIADSIRHITDTLSDNPRLAQLLIDLSISGIVEKSNLLTAETPALRGVAEIAAEMKLPITIKNRGDLGKFIVAAGFSPLQEKRLVNGAMRDVNCYPDTPELRSTIESFFN